MIIETDHFNPVQIINLTSSEVIHSLHVSEVILEAQFLNASNQQLTLHCAQSLIIIDLQTKKQYRTPQILATSFAVNVNNTVVTCHNN